LHLHFHIWLGQHIFEALPHQKTETLWSSRALPVSNIGEGYPFRDCDSSAQYYDNAGYGDSGNWQAPVRVSSSATSVKIIRETADGTYALTQTIKQKPANALAQLSLALKNSSSTSHHVGLLRYADVFRLFKKQHSAIGFF